MDKGVGSWVPSALRVHPGEGKGGSRAEREAGLWCGLHKSPNRGTWSWGGAQLGVKEPGLHSPVVRLPRVGLKTRRFAPPATGKTPRFLLADSPASWEPPGQPAASPWSDGLCREPRETLARAAEHSCLAQARRERVAREQESLAPGSMRREVRPLRAVDTGLPGVRRLRSWTGQQPWRQLWSSRGFQGPSGHRQS